MKDLSYIRLPLAVVSILGVGLGLAGCQKAAPKRQQIAPVPVTVARATVENVPSQLQEIGSVQAVSTVQVKSLVGGELKTVNFKQGDDVRKGQVLFTIDSQPYEAALAQAKANLARDRATDMQAQVEAKRYADLAKQGIVSAEQNDQLQAAATADDSIVTADKAAVQTAELNLSYCTIRSPIDGRTGSLLVQAGNVVQANNSILVTINQISPIYVSFSVPEQYLLQLKHYDAAHPLTVKAQAQGDPNLETGTLSFINNSIDSSTGTIQLMGTFQNHGRHLWPGEYVDSTLTLSVADNATVVPSAAVQTGPSSLYVFVLTPKNTVEQRTVTTGITTNGLTVITKGVTPGETVITDGQLALTPGARVLVRQASADSTPSSKVTAAQ